MGAPPEVMVLAALRTELLFVRGPKAALGMGETARAGLRGLLNRFPLKGAVFLGYCGGLAAGLRPALSSSPTGWMARKARFARMENFWKKRRISVPKPIWGRFSPIPCSSGRKRCERKPWRKG